MNSHRYCHNCTRTHRLTLKSNSLCSTLFYLCAEWTTFSMLPWLSLVLTTSCRILHSTIPHMESFAFQPGNNKARDKHIFRYLIWSHSGFRPHEPKPDRGSVLVAYQPPYILTQSDLKEFTSCKTASFPHIQRVLRSMLNIPDSSRISMRLRRSCRVSIVFGPRFVQNPFFDTGYRINVEMCSFGMLVKQPNAIGLS